MVHLIIIYVIVAMMYATVGVVVYLAERGWSERNARKFARLVFLSPVWPLHVIAWLRDLYWYIYLEDEEEEEE